MSRARAQSGPSISLFPFLAVLLCTMGSLLVVLVIFSRSAKQAGIAAAEQARAEAAAAADAERQELELARDEIGWRIDHMRSIRDRTAEDLAKARMQLAGTEENARQLADELDGQVVPTQPGAEELSDGRLFAGDRGGGDQRLQEFDRIHHRLIL